MHTRKVSDIDRSAFCRHTELRALEQSVNLCVDSSDAVTVLYVASFIHTMHLAGYRAVVASCDDPVIFNDGCADAETFTCRPERQQHCLRHKIFMPVDSHSATSVYSNIRF